MADSLILRSQADEMLQSIQDSRMDPSSFHWATTASVITVDLKVSKLIHSQTQYYFQFDLHQGSHYCRFSPGESTQTENQYPGSWNGQFQYFQRWIGYLKREIEAPDLWKAIAQECDLIAAVSKPETDNTQFSQDEIKHLSQSLREIKEHLLLTVTLDQEQTKFVEMKFDHLESAAQRIGRKDWLTFALGILTNIVVGLALKPNVARELFRAAGQVLSWLLQSQQFLP